MTRGRRYAWLASVAALLVAYPAVCDLGHDALRLSAAWKRHGAVQQLAPRLAERTAPTLIFLPTDLERAAPRTCATVAILGPNSTHFTVRAVGGGALLDAPEDWPQASLAGLVQLTRCGARRVQLSALLIEMRSPRAVLETILVQSRDTVRPATEVLPQRDPGPIAPVDVSARPSPAPIAKRLAAHETRARRDGALELLQDSVQASLRGTGRVRRSLGTGCHRIDFIAEPPTKADPSYDLQIFPELDAAASLVSLERGDGLDAALTLCAADASTVEIGFTGAPRHARIWLVTARSALPEGLPETWGSTGRARVAAVLRRHHVRVNQGPVDHALGIQGATLLPIRVEPFACYVAVLTAVRGEPLVLALGAVSGSVTAQNHGGQGGTGTLVSFCARSRTHALLEADSRGNGLVWLYALYQVGRTSPGGGALP